MKIDILAIGAHPDDVELSCSGTLLRHSAAGATFGIADLTKGELGTRGNAELRLKEAEIAKNILGAKFRINLGMKDGFFEISRENILRVASLIRNYKPDFILCNAVSDRHPDHGKASELVTRAAFFSGLSKIELRDDAGNILEAHRPKTVYHYIQDRFLKPDFVVDVTPFVEKKFESIKAFSSQFYDPSSSEPDSPISGADFFDFIRGRMKDLGRDAGFEYAEGYTVERVIGVDSFMNFH